MSLYHNKKRDTGLLFEFLIRHISKCLVDNKKEEAAKAAALSKKFFSQGTVLHEEFKLFKIILDTKVKSRLAAQRVVSEVLSENAKINARKLDAEKSKLIKEINYTLKNKDFFGYKIPNYTIYASVHSLFVDERNKKKTLDAIDRIKIEESIVEHLIRKNDVVVNVLKTDSNYNNAVYKFVVERFNKKYSDKLNEHQKKLLTKYSLYLVSENKGVMKSAIQKEVEDIKQKLRSIKEDSVSKDVDLLEKINECYKKLVTTNFDNIVEENVLQLLQFMKLVEEIES
jgi:hypothetical protein